MVRASVLVGTIGSGIEILESKQMKNENDEKLNIKMQFPNSPALIVSLMMFRRMPVNVTALNRTFSTLSVLGTTEVFSKTSVISTLMDPFLYNIEESFSCAVIMYLECSHRNHQGYDHLITVLYLREAVDS